MTIESKDVATLVGVAVTLLLGVYNAIQNYRTSQRTTFINTVTSERVKWIEKIRQSISTYCAAVHYWRVWTVEGSDEERKKIEEIEMLRHLIVLQLNPEGMIDREVQRLVGEIASMSTGTSATDSADFRVRLQILVEKTQLLLKAEWEKVKAEARQGELASQGVRD